MVATGATLLFLAYWLIFALTTDDGLARGAIAAFNNTLPAIALAWLFHLVLDRYVWPASLTIRLAAQVPLSIVFTLAWYIAILIVRELREGWIANGFSIHPFAPVAFAWQMFQGVTFYTLTALASLAINLSRKLHAAGGKNLVRPLSSAQTILLRTNEGSEVVPVETIITITGAGDYSEVSLPGRKILSTTTLADFEMRLPQDGFIRAHRSHIVRLGAITRSESAGNGRTVLHLLDGQTVTTSRAGTRILREAAL